MVARTRVTVSLVIAASLLLFTGCGGGAPADDPVPPAAEETTSPAESPEEPAAEEGDGPAGGAAYTDPAADSLAVSVTATGFDPDAITVPVGGTVTFTAADEGPHGLYVGDLDGFSVMGGLTATFRFDIAGTYRVFDEISEAEATVTVE